MLNIQAGTKANTPTPLLGGKWRPTGSDFFKYSDKEAKQGDEGMYEQYWDCDHCQERYPHAHPEWRPIEVESGDEMLWLCGECAKEINK